MLTKPLKKKNRWDDVIRKAAPETKRRVYVV
jgi:hypothetical protein